MVIPPRRTISNRPFVISRTSSGVSKRLRITSVRISAELVPWRRLIGAHAAGGDVGLCVALAAHRRADEAPQHHQLTDVRERVCDRTLEEPRRAQAQRSAAGEVSVERLESAV